MFPHFGGGQTKYQIGHSLRLRSAASASLSTTGFTSGGTPAKITFSTRIKRGKLGYQALVATYSDANNIGAFYINANDRIHYYNWQGGAFTVNKESVAVFRDLSAHYHFVLIIDTTLANAEDRFQIWVNGVRITSWTTNTNTHTQNAGQMIGYAAGGVTQRIGANPDGTTFNDAYFSDIHYLWANKAAASDFGQLDENGVWVPKKPTGITYGAYGAHLDFSNGSSTTTLGYDKNGVNNWTCNNISLTAGATYDWMTDTPTNNYCTVDPLTPSNNNASATDGLISLTAAAGANAYLGRRGAFVMTSGKWYWEVNMGIKDASAGQWYQVGIIAYAHPWPAASTIGAWNGGYAYYNDGQKGNNASYAAYGATFASGDVLGVAFDADAGTLTFYKNGTSQGQAYSGIIGSVGYVPAFEFYRSTGTTQYMYPNFGQRPFAYTPPTGFKALCTANLPAAPVKNPAKHFNVVGWAGTGTSQWQSNATEFNADFCWIKNRTEAYNNVLVDVVRGDNKGLHSNTTDVEDGGIGVLIGGYGAYTAYAGQIYTNGGASWPELNKSGDNYINWRWKANGSGVSNTDGSITSTVSANQAAGFSIVTGTAQTSGIGTFGHGLGVAPKLIILKSRTSAYGWPVFHTSLGVGTYVSLNVGNASAPDVNQWNNTAPTSTIVTLGSNFANYGNFVAYCFAEIPGYSKFGSYIGNGSADGPFVWCGFRPRWLMVKRSSTSEDWCVVDIGRTVNNGSSDNVVYPSLANAEWSSGDIFDILSNGFKLRSTTLNPSNETYIFAAFAEHPFGGVNVAPSPAR